jgi:hypothetical protein
MRRWRRSSIWWGAGGGDEERLAARIGILVQSHDATIALIDGVDVPVRELHRRGPNGKHLLIDVAACGPQLMFGGGRRPCPGQATSALRRTGLRSIHVLSGTNRSCDRAISSSCRYRVMHCGRRWMSSSRTCFAASSSVRSRITNDWSNHRRGRVLAPEREGRPVSRTWQANPGEVWELIHTRSGQAKWLAEISHAHPMWVHPSDAERLGVDVDGLVRITTRIGHFVDPRLAHRGHPPRRGRRVAPPTPTASACGGPTPGSTRT